MNKLKNLVLFLGISFFLNCSNPTEIPEDAIPKKVNMFAKTFIENLHNGNIDNCLNVSGTEVNNENGHEFLNNAYNNIKYFKAKSIKLVGYNLDNW